MDRCAPSRVHQQELCAQEHREGVCGSPGIATMLENLFSAHDRAAPYDERDTDIGRIFSSTVFVLRALCRLCSSWFNRRVRRLSSVHLS